MKKSKPADFATEIDAKSEELMQEFFNHVQQFLAAHPGDNDPRKIFESWAIQKIAALQFTVLQLGAKLNEMAAQIHKQ